MPRQSISQSQLHAINNNQLDLMVEGAQSKSDFRVLKLDDLADTLTYLGGLYALKLTENLNKADASSSGELSKSIQALDVSIFGSVYTVEIEAAKYAKFIDQGVDGWAKSRGSKYKFKKSTRKRGEPFSGKSEMVENIKAWLLREGKMIRNTKKATTKREARQMSITDATTRAAISAAYMIKRQGIKPTYFWRDTTKEMKRIVEMELAKALKVDIINAIVQ